MKHSVLIEPNFRQILVMLPYTNTEKLAKYTDRLIYILQGDMDVEDFSKLLKEKYIDFSPDSDAIVPVGRITSSFALGWWIGRTFPHSPITVGIYRDKDYEFVKLMPEFCP